MATTLDPANIHNFSGVGTLSNGNLTISSTGNSTGQSTTAATGKKTFQVTVSAATTFWVFCGLSSTSAASDGISIGYNANWVIKDSSGSAIFNGPASPAPSAGMIITVDVDTVGKTVSVRVNGTAVFTNSNIATQAPATWRALAWAADTSVTGAPTFTSTVAFSGLTYAPLSGYTAWDGVTSVSITGAAASALAGAVTPRLDDSVSLTGASCSAVAGPTTETASVALTGATAAALAGTAGSTVSDSAAITGASCAAQAGSTSTQIADSVSLTGAASSALAGAVTTQSGSSSSVSVTGASVAAVAGSVTASTSDQAIISGASAAALAGSVGSGESTAAPGAVCTALAGSIAAAIQTLATGAMAAALAGGIAIGLAAIPTGAEARALAGSVAVQYGGTVGISGAAVQALAGGVGTNIIVTTLNPNYIARGGARSLVAAGTPRARVSLGRNRRMVALGQPRGTIATGAKRDRTVVGISNAMSQTENLVPAIDATVEEETVTFDYGIILASGVTLTGTPTVTCAVYSGTDPTPAARLIGQPAMRNSPNSGAANAAVAQLVGDMLDGVTYRLQCVCQTSDGQKLSLWTHLSCQAPN